MRKKTWAGLGLAGVLMVGASVKADDPSHQIPFPNRSYADLMVERENKAEEPRLPNRTYGELAIERERVEVGSKADFNFNPSIEERLRRIEEKLDRILEELKGMKPQEQGSKVDAFNFLIGAYY